MNTILDKGNKERNVLYFAALFKNAYHHYTCMLFSTGHPSSKKTSLVFGVINVCFILLRLFSTKIMN